jgi:hypothetical protein
MSSEQGSPAKLPPAHGASPRPGSEAPSARKSGVHDSSLSSSEQDLKMIHWYKLANEAAMKAALVKHKRFKEVPR